MMRHLNSQHYRNLLIDQMEEQRLHQRVDLYLGLLVMLKLPIIWDGMETSQGDILRNQGHLREEYLLEVHIVVRRRPEEAWVHLQQVEDLVKMDALTHETSLVLEVGKGQQQVLYILDRRDRNRTT